MNLRCVRQTKLQMRADALVCEDATVEIMDVSKSVTTIEFDRALYRPRG